MRERTFPRVTARKSRRQGFTLVEIMVALVIFVFGAIAILRIFPQGLGIVRDTEHRAVATRMSRTTLGEQESRIAVQPEAVYNFDPASTFPGGWAEAINLAGQALSYTGGPNSNSIPRGPQDPIQETALGRFGRIRGERQTVKNASGGAYTGSYVLTRFPYVGDPTAPPELRKVYVYREEIINGVRISASGFLDFSRAKTANGASFSGTPAVRPPDTHRHSMALTDAVDDTTYYVSYLWQQALSSGSPRVQGVTEESLRMPKDTTAPVWTDGVDGRVTTMTGTVIPGLVQVRLRQLASIVTSSTTPTSPVLTPPQDFNDATAGLVRLSLSAGQSVSLDYNVADWQALAHDETVSNPSPAETPAPTVGKRWTVSAPMRGIDGEPGITTLFIRSNGTVEWAQLKGTVTNSGGATGSTIFEPGFNGPASRLTYDTPDNTQTRTVYRTLDNWSHQLGVAARTYQHFITNRATAAPNSPREGWREFVWLPGNNPNGGKLYFQPSDAGKVVMVTYEYMDGTTPRLISNAMVPIGEELIETGSIPTFPAGFAPVTSRVVFAQLSDLQGNPLGAGVSAVRSVQGVSTMARTAWIRGQRYSQVIAKGMRPLVQ